MDDANARLEPLKKEVQTLQVYQQRRVELQGEMEALQKQLATLQAIVPENKEIDQFIIMVQGAASGAGVSIRKIATQPVVAKQYHFEMPVTVTADGPYFSVMDFFARLARLSRIINVGDVKLDEVKPGAGTGSFRMSPGTTVTGSFSITTYFTEPAQETAAGTQTSAAAAGKH
ncbi:MAG TPA: type 4a pilus biogenesis protein PilO [Candidatus Acidoferrales bacterium]|nr:type 4a pilus biogenesis protein PilO [Candidatus Acidoferrales bacterium]